MCFMWISEQTAIISLYSINWLVFIRDLTPYSPVVTICTASLTFNNSTFCPHSVFMCFVCISEQTAIISLNNINWLVFITETECVYCAVRAGSLNQSDSISSFKGYHRSIHTHDKKPTNQNNTATGPPRGALSTINKGTPHVQSSIWCSRHTSKHTLIYARK